MRPRLPRGRHIFAAVVLLMELPVLLVLLAGAVVTGAVYGATRLPGRVRTLLERDGTRSPRVAVAPRRREAVRA